MAAPAPVHGANGSGDADPHGNGDGRPRTARPTTGRSGAASGAAASRAARAAASAAARAARAGPNGPGGQGGPEGGPGGLRWDPTDPAQRRARYALLSGMWAFFFALFNLPEIALLLGALAVYWGDQLAARAKPQQRAGEHPATKRRPAPDRLPAAAPAGGGPWSRDRRPVRTGPGQAADDRGGQRTGHGAVSRSRSSR